MDFDLALVSLPASTQKCPSLGLATLASYLQERYNIFWHDYGLDFYNTALKNFKITNPLVNTLNLNLYLLWGASNWVGLSDTVAPEVGQSIIKSLCPVCSDLYQPLFTELKNQLGYTLKILDSYAEDLVRLDTINYGFSFLLGNAIPSLYVIGKIKEEKPESNIIVGGPETSLYYRAGFYSQMKEIDFTVYWAEGEVPVERILDYLSGKIHKKSNIPGICLKAGGGIQKTAPPPLIDLNKPPIPDFSAMELRSSDSLRTIDILTSKGCPYHCRFCNESLIWGPYRPKSKKRISEEIQYYINNYGSTQFELGDNSYEASSTFLPALEHLFKNGYRFEWGGNCRVNELNSQNILQYQQLGLTHCYFGIESASPKILDRMAKQIDITHASELLQICHQNQIHSTLYFMVGYPGETAEEFQKTLNFIDGNREYIDDITTSVFTLMAGTPIMHSDDLISIPLGPKYLNAFTYQTKDGITHTDRKNRFLKIHELWKST